MHLSTAACCPKLEQPTKPVVLSTSRVLTCWRTRESWVGWAQGNIQGGWIKHSVLSWWCMYQAWQHQPLPDLLLTCTPAEGNPLPPTLRHLPKMASAKLIKAAALFHWHSFVCIRGFARIISLARRGWLFLGVSTQHMYTGKIIWSHFTACLVPKKELMSSNSVSGRKGNEIELPISSQKCYMKLLHSYIESIILGTIGA